MDPTVDTSFLPDKEREEFLRKWVLEEKTTTFQILAGVDHPGEQINKK